MVNKRIPFEVFTDGFALPTIMPLPDGGFQAEWHKANHELEIVVPDGEPERYYYYNASTGEEEEEDLDPQNLAHIRELISRF